MCRHEIFGYIAIWYGGTCQIFLMPSHYEPCGTAQLISMRYGTIPIVRKTGGLTDTVIDYSSSNRGTGFVFEQMNEWVMLYTINKAVKVYKEITKTEWQKFVKTIMTTPVNWEQSILNYIDLYKKSKKICSQK